MQQKSRRHRCGCAAAWASLTGQLPDDGRTSPTDGTSATEWGVKNGENLHCHGKAVLS